MSAEEKEPDWRVEAIHNANDREREKIRSWLWRATGPKRASFLRCFRFQLVHDADKGRSPVCPDAFCESQEDLVTINEDARKELVDEATTRFFQAAEGKAAQFNRVQSFELLGYISKEDEAEPKDSLTININPRFLKKESMGLEPATEAGERGQIQRAFENLLDALTAAHRENTKERKDLLDFVGEDRKELRGELKAMREENRKMFSDFQDAMDRAVDRKLKTDRAGFYLDLEKRGWTEGINLLTAIVPKIADRWGGGPAGAFIREVFTDPEMAALIKQARPFMSPKMQAKFNAAVGVYAADLFEDQPETVEAREVVTPQPPQNGAGPNPTPASGA